MNENSKLIPSKITVQSNAAITTLKADIEHLEQARKATNAFINDDSNNTLALNNLKSKMQNYQLAIDTFIRAKELAIKDHQKLINLVSGVPPLVGSVILQQIQDKKHDRIFYEGRIEHYKQVQNDTNFWNSINPFDWTHSNAGRNISRCQGLLDNTNEIIANYEQKIETYYEIEQATKELFVETNELIAKTKLGIGHIGQASAGLPSSFHTRALGAWRVDILETKEIELEIFVTLEMLENIPPEGFFMGETEEERQQNLMELNRILHLYDINTPERIRHFFAQLMIETNNGQWLTEGDYWDATEEAWDMWYPFRFRGAGHIQLTHEFHYQAFATYQLRLMFPELNIRWENPENTEADIVRITNVVNLGTDFVATEFPWDTAGYFWYTGNVNTVIDGLTPNDPQGAERVTDVVNFHTPSRLDRVGNYGKLSNIIQLRKCGVVAI